MNELLITFLAGVTIGAIGSIVILAIVLNASKPPTPTFTDER